MRNASGQQGENKWQRRKRSEQERIRHFLHKTCTRRFLEISRCSSAKQRQRNVQKRVLHVQSFFLLIRPTDVLDSFCCRRRLELQDFIFCLSKL